MAAPVMEKLAYRNLMTLADLTPSQILYITRVARQLKARSEQILTPRHFAEREKNWEIKSEIRRAHPQQTLRNMSIGLLFSKRSTRTRLAAETAAKLLGGQAIFLGKDDIQLGVNESARDTAMVLSRMVQGIFARVGDHSEIEEIAKYSKVPVINALSSLWHPTQVLADLATLENIREFWVDPKALKIDDRAKKALRPLTIAYVGDSANVLHDMLVTYPRLGHTLQVASPDNAKYRAPTPVWDRVVELGCDKSIKWTADPREAVCGADVVVTDTWISMGQEAEYEERVNAFKGYQVTEKLCAEGKANPNWKFLHCLPRKQHEVDDEVFYGPRSFVWPEAENRKWTIMAIFHLMIGGARTNPFETPSDAFATMENF